MEKEILYLQTDKLFNLSFQEWYTYFGFIELKFL